MMQRWDDLTPDEQQRYRTAEDLRTQLAAMTARAEAAEADAKTQRNAKDAAIARNGELHRELHAMRQQAEAAEAALVRANEKIKRLEQRLGIYST